MTVSIRLLIIDLRSGPELRFEFFEQVGPEVHIAELQYMKVSKYGRNAYVNSRDFYFQS